MVFRPLQQRRRLRKAEHQIKILHRRAGGAFDQVVFRTDQNQAAADDAGRDVDEVGVGGVLGRGKMLDDADEGLAGVEFLSATKASPPTASASTATSRRSSRS